MLELFAFVCPARPLAPTPRGLALALDLRLPATLEAMQRRELVSMLAVPTKPLASLLTT